MSDVFATALEQYKTFVAPVVKANKLAVAGFEKLVAFQFATAQSYADLSLARLKAAAEVEDVKGLQAFYTAQLDTVAALRQKLLDDAKALTDLGNGFKAEFDKLAEETAAELPKAVQALAPRQAA
ncbi:phasin family protein [Plasticicumulans lactativorans]|uniref:Phasin family protein n=1 Tax=Plasticicumulans lactativorans TaxID=1133106 RepID=A0A4R2L7P4_9GAMM|nr:phasin family protein [Plasticicumulans lactativorans]TCO83519.1 phasin family protein [Plasticicumulans lactativorans]